jgi:uncharacterized membrane protein YczE
MLPKLLTLLTGLFIMSLGIALSVKADLGLAPISCVPYIYSLACPLSMGETAIVMMVIFVLLQILILRRSYRPLQLVQLPAAIAFGYFIDLSRFLTSELSVPGYGGRLALCLLSCAVIGFGVFLELRSELTYLPGEGLVAAIAECCGKEFGRIKVGFDCLIVLFAALSALILMGKVKGIGEGTVAAAVLVGSLVRLFKALAERLAARRRPRLARP